MQDWLSHRVAATPDDTALVRAATGTSLTFADVDEVVDETAEKLGALGVEPGDTLGMVVPTSVHAVCLVYAAMRLGASLAPLSDRATASELAPKLDAIDPSVVVCADPTESLARDAVRSASADPTLASVGALDAGAETETTAGDTDGTTPAPESEGPEVTALASVSGVEVTPATWERSDTFLVLFTSGTTGRAKAVPLTLGNVLASAMSSAFRLGLDPEDRWLVALSLHHAGGITPVLRGPLYGMTVVLREGFDAGGTADDIDRYDVTAVSVVPTMLRRMLDSRGTLSDSLRVVLVGGAPAPPALVERCRDYAIPVYPTYGMTETASQVATATPQEAYADPETVGRPLFMTDVTVVDADDTPVSRGEVGELVVAGPTVTPGYDDEAATRAAFCAHGLKTGDVGYVDDDGRLYVLGRLDDQILTGGENVTPGEVVDVLRTHPDIEDAAVVGIPDDEWGERVAALVVPAAAADLSVDAVRSHCREDLAGFKLPRTVAFCEEIPRTVSGTVDREAVREYVRAHGSDGDAADFEFDTSLEAADGDETRDESSNEGSSGEN